MRALALALAVATGVVAQRNVTVMDYVRTDDAIESLTFPFGFEAGGEGELDVEIE